MTARDTPPTVRLRSFARADRSLLDEVKAAGSPDLARVLGADVVADPVLRPAWKGARVVGPALTVKLAAGDNLGAIVAALHAQAGDVLVFEIEHGSTTAVVGALLARTARSRGVAGMIVDGPIRDTADLETMRFPVWAAVVSPRQSAKVRDAEIGVAVTCGGCTVEPGCIVLADQDGVVFAPPARLRDRLEAVRSTLADEKRFQDADELERAMQSILAGVRVVTD